MPPFTDASGLSHTTTTGHLALFNKHLEKADGHVERIYSNGANDIGLPPDLVIKGPKTCLVKVMVDGEFYGRGRADKRKKAYRNWELWSIKFYFIPSPF